jgi:hypothetical protein
MLLARKARFRHGAPRSIGPTQVPPRQLRRFRRSSGFRESRSLRLRERSRDRAFLYGEVVSTQGWLDDW